jgi:hypothetical protein
MAWTANNKYYLTGSITSGLTLSINNADAGTVPTDMSVTTYDDGTYDDYNYEITGIYQGTYESSFTANDVVWISSGDTNDIKYQYATSDDGITYSNFTTLSDGIGTTQIQINASYFKFRLIFYSSYWTDTDSFQMDTITRKFTVFVNGGIVDANEWLSNYYVCGAEDLLPRDGANMQLTNSALDLGSSAQLWDNVYVNNLFVDGELGGTLNQIGKTTLSASATKIEFTGLTDDVIYMKCKFLFNTVTSDDTLLFFNQDSSTVYGYQLIFGTAGSRFNTQTGIVLTQGGSIATKYISGFDGWLMLGAAQEKMIVGNGFVAAGGTTIENTFMLGGMYNNTSNTITSIQITNVSSFEIGTEVSIWAKR